MVNINQPLEFRISSVPFNGNTDEHGFLNVVLNHFVFVPRLHLLIGHFIFEGMVLDLFAEY